jgi:hypothetical protein
MGNRLAYVLIAIMVLSFSAKFLIIPHNQGLWWDEAVYLGLAESLQEGRYSLEQSAPLETFRPPVMPVLFSVYPDMLWARMLVFLTSVLSVIAIYWMGREFYGKRAGMWAALFLSASYLFIYFSTKALSEPLFIAFSALSLTLFARYIREPSLRPLALAGLFAGLTFLTRYFGGLIIFAYVLFFCYLAVREKRRARSLCHLAALVAVFVLTISPWMLMSLHYYGSPFGGFLVNFEVYSGSFSSTLHEGLLGLGGALNIIGLLMLPGIWFAFRGAKHRRHSGLLLLLAALSLASYMMLAHKEPRYLLSFYPMYAVFAGLGMGSLKAIRRRHVEAATAAAVLAIMAFSMCSGLSGAWDDRTAALGLVEASLELGSLTGPGEAVMATSYPYVYYLSKRSTVPFPRDVSGMDPGAAAYAVFYKFEPGNPEGIGEYLEKNFEKVKSFAQWGDPEAVIIYRLG